MGRQVPKSMITLLVMVIFATAFLVVKSALNTSINTLICNEQSCEGDGAYRVRVNFVLADLMNETPYRRGSGYYSRSPPPSSAFGHAICSPGLAHSECASCVAAARDTVSIACSGYTGGRVEMVGCSMRYDNYPFKLF